LLIPDSNSPTVGGDADTRTTKNDTTFTAFSLAAKNSWKDARPVNGRREQNGGHPLLTADEKMANALAAYFPVRWLGAFC